MDAADQASEDNSAIRRILKRLNHASSDIQASAVMTRDGHTVSAVLANDANTVRVGAMCASMLSLAEKTTMELACGRLQRVLIEGEEGNVLIVQIGARAVLTVVSRTTRNLGMVFVEAKKTAQEIADANLIP